jgi:HK97 family phage portal protein
MRWFGRRAEPQPQQEAREDISLADMLRLRHDTWGVSYTPVPVTVERALTHPASFACIDVLASSASQLPVDVVRKQGKIRIPVLPAPGLIASPSALVLPDVWRYQLVESMCTDGNGWGMIAGYDPAGRPTGIELIDPYCVGDRRVVNGIKQASVNGKTQLVYPFGDLWHVPGKMIRAGRWYAESPIARAAATIGAALAAREFGSRFFGDGGHPTWLLKPDTDPGEDGAETLKRAWMNSTHGNREPIVSQLTATQVSINPDDSQFIELMRWVVEESCRFWRVPPAMVYAATSGQNITYANASQADLNYLKWSLDGYLTRIEAALTVLLAGPQNVVFNRNALLRLDVVTRNQVYDIRLRNETMTVNEVKALEDEEPYSDPKFDQPGIPAGLAPPAAAIPGIPVK